MTTKDIVNEKLNELEQSLLNQDHINTPIEFLTQLASLSKYFHLMSDEDRDYVVVHELCHMLEHNHSSKYWKYVERHVPNWRECREWLKHNELAKDL